MEELTGQALAEIQNLCKLGDEHTEGGRHSEALKAYWSAWALIPEPKTNWDAATWVLAAIGDANFLSADYAACRDNLTTAMSCPGAIGNPLRWIAWRASQ